MMMFVCLDFIYAYLIEMLVLHLNLNIHVSVCLRIDLAFVVFFYVFNMLR